MEETNKTPPATPTPPNLREVIKSSVSKMDPKVSKEEKKEHAKTLLKIFEKGMTPKEAMAISDLEISEIYSYAYQLFLGGHYDKAQVLFHILTILEPSKSNFAIALGVCYHKLKDYDHAEGAYMLASINDPDDPLPLFYAYDCFLQQGKNYIASIMLNNVIVRSGTQSKYAKLKAKAEDLLEEVEKKITWERNAVV